MIKALARGMSDGQIAKSLSISEKTVRNHTSNIYRKLHIFDRTQPLSTPKGRHRRRGPGVPPPREPSP